MVESTFPTIKHCIFLFNEQLVWSEINPTDLYSIYEYLIGSLFPKITQNTLGGVSLSRQSSIVSLSSVDTSHYGSFVTGPDKFPNTFTVPKVNIFNDGKSVTYKLVIYQALSATLCMFLEGNN